MHEFEDMMVRHEIFEIYLRRQDESIGKLGEWGGGGGGGGGRVVSPPPPPLTKIQTVPVKFSCLTAKSSENPFCVQNFRVT